MEALPIPVTDLSLQSGVSSVQNDRSIWHKKCPLILNILQKQNFERLTCSGQRNSEQQQKDGERQNEPHRVKSERTRRENLRNANRGSRSAFLNEKKTTWPPSPASCARNSSEPSSGEGLTMFRQCFISRFDLT